MLISHEYLHLMSKNRLLNNQSSAKLLPAMKLEKIGRDPSRNGSSHWIWRFPERFWDMVNDDIVDAGQQVQLGVLDSLIHKFL